MVSSNCLSFTSPVGKRVVCVLIVVQILVLGVVYYSRVTIWNALNEKMVPTDDSSLVYTGIPFTDTPMTNPNRNRSTINFNVTLPGSTKTHVHTEETIIDEKIHDDRVKVAVGLGITTRGLTNLQSDNMRTKMPFFKSLLSSFCKTCSSGYNYNFFMAYDYNDVYMSSSKFLTAFEYQFMEFVTENCLKTSSYSIHLVRCNHTRKPAWAQNDAMMEAYLSGMDYFYRINDDTIMKTSGWTELFIKTLNEMSPPRVGVVGPKHQGGNEAILTYDFTHKTHAEIHGFYYPRYFTDWYADKWITDVYKPGRSTKLSSVQLKHTMETGQRYKNVVLTSSQVKTQVYQGQQSVQNYVIMMESARIPSDPRKIISMSIYSLAPDVIWGVIRNAQLVSILFPGWTLRVYTEDKQSPNQFLHVPQRILDRLVSLGAQVVYTNSQEIPITAVHYLVADDPDVDAFLIRKPLARLNSRDAAAVAVWLQQADEGSCVHSIKDHKDQVAHSIVNGQWGALSNGFRKLMGTDSMKSLLDDFLSQTRHAKDAIASFPQEFLNQVLWNKIKDHVLCHDSVSCTVEAPGTVLPFPTVSKQKTYVGQPYQAFEVPMDSSSSSMGWNAQCEKPAR